MVAVSGQLRFREWEGEEGEKRSEHTIAADRVDFLPGGKKRGGSDSEDGGEEGSGLVTRPCGGPAPLGAGPP